jgi:cell fate regulator YaaT (PSP1 superfamily)
MAHCQFVRVGSLGHIGRFASLDRVCYPRHARVVLRTARGLEIGEVLSAGEELHRRQSDGTILRGVTPEDLLLETRLKKQQQQAFEACTRRLGELDLPVTLMDAELLFDGRSLYFYFVGAPPAELEEIVDELAEIYETNAQIRQFAETLLHGCGPDCGTADAASGGCSSCGAGCAVAAACGTRHR